MIPEEQVAENIIEITAMRFSIDWTYDTKHKIVLKDIWGIELDWRGDDWHVIVVTKEKDLNLKNVTYELDHWVPIIEIKKLLANPQITIRKIGNMHSSKNFIQELQKVLSQ
jgi:hypothetical protein